MPFIKNELSKIAEEGATIVDIFAGSGSVSLGLKDKYQVIANDAEKYSSTITSAFLTPPSSDLLYNLREYFYESYKQMMEEFTIDKDVKLESLLLLQGDNDGLESFYSQLPSVWNGAFTPSHLRDNHNYNLFRYYYSGTYFGLMQSIEIDTIVRLINSQDEEVRDVLFSCLFFAIKEVVFSKDGHMAQPLSIRKNPDRHIKQRNKKVILYFLSKLDEFIEKSEDVTLTGYNHKVLNENFLNLMNDKILKYKPTVIYADPPYTDMQYSRYYHVLNVARNYDYPELTKIQGAYTKGLYTEGRNQSGLSQKSKAKKQIETLLRFANENDIKVVLSYAFPEDENLQATDRYTVTIENLIDMAKQIYGSDQVYSVRENYKHANHRNSSQKKVYEYLIICGHQREVRPLQYNLRQVKHNINELSPSSKNDLYNSHLYWSQKSFNVIDELIRGLSDEGDIVFDPFMGSGVTVLEAINNDMNRIGIGCDVNEMPIFISNTLLKDMFSTQALEIIDRFEEDLENLRKYYLTTCTACKGEANINKVIFDKPNRTSNEGLTIHSIDFTCQNCGRSLKKPDDSDYEKMLNSSYLTRNIKDIPLIKNTKIAVGDDETIEIIFTPRNYKVLDEIVGYIDNYSFSNIPNYLLMSMLHLAKITDTHSNSQWPLWIPKINCVEKNIIDILNKKIKNIRKTVKFVNKKYYPNSVVENFAELEQNKALLLLKGSQNITDDDIEDNSVSLIITDPPYMEQVMYSEYMQLYKPFLGLDFNLKDEIVVSSSPERKKDKVDYFHLLDQVFSMCSRKLKIEGYMCLFFHDSNLDVWARLIDLLEKNGFKFVSQEHIKKSKTVKNILSPKKSLNGDAVLFFTNLKEPLGNYESTTDLTVIEQNIFEHTKFLLNKNGAMSTPELYDNGLMEILIENGWLKKFSSKYTSLVEFFEGKLIWQKENGKWRLT